MAIRGDLSDHPVPTTENTEAPRRGTVNIDVPRSSVNIQAPRDQSKSKALAEMEMGSDS